MIYKIFLITLSFNALLMTNSIAADETPPAPENLAIAFIKTQIDKCAQDESTCHERVARMLKVDNFTEFRKKRKFCLDKEDYCLANLKGACENGCYNALKTQGIKHDPARDTCFKKCKS